MSDAAELRDDGGPAVCDKCGARVVEYRHGLSRGLVRTLTALDRAGGTAALRDLGLSRSEADNHQKTRYWNLSEKVYGEDGTRRAGVWRLTTAGMAFLDGERQIFKFVWTYRGETTRYDGPMLHVWDVDQTAWDQRADYAGAARPHQRLPHQMVML